MIETMIESSPEIGELAKALAKAQAEFEPLTNGALNTHFSNRYASLAEIVKATRPALNKHGIFFSQHPSAGAGAIMVTTRLQHESAQFIQSTHTIPVSKGDAQGYGSALTYARRQAAQAVLGVALEGEDDDGEGAVGRGAGRPPIPPQEPPRSPLAARIANLERTINGVKTLQDFDRAWSRSADLQKELLAADPAEHARITELGQTRRADLLRGAG
jgi:hypothetical protein